MINQQELQFLNINLCRLWALKTKRIFFNNIREKICIVNYFENLNRWLARCYDFQVGCS